MGICLVSAVFARVWWRLNPLKFNPVNGDFQTFNAARRLLDGQVPFVDFLPYLGLGPSYLTAAGTALFGGDFAASVIAAEILSAGAFVLLVYLTMATAGARRPFEWAGGLYLVSALAATVLFGSDWLTLRLVGGVLLMVLGMATTSLINPGHSLLILRVIWPFLLVPLFRWSMRSPSSGRLCWFGAALGFGFLWSPDYGVATALAFLSVIALSRVLSFAHLAVLVSITAGASAISVYGFTRGDPLSWIKFASSVSQYQRWYYRDETYKALSVEQILDSAIGTTNLFLLALAAGATVMLAVRFWRSRNVDDAITLALLAATFLAGSISSVGSAFVPYYMSAATTVVLCVALAHLSRSDARWYTRTARGVALLLPIALLVATVGIVLKLSRIERTAPAGPAQMSLGVALDPEMHDFERFVRYVAERTDKPWSTYATGLEAAMRTHHPTGTDYIIHALGFEGRQRYLRAFEEARPTVVVTPRLASVLWESWSRRANFDFYRRMMTQYMPTEHFSHWTVWERMPAPVASERAVCIVELRGEGQVALRAVGGAPNRLLDIEVAYHAKWADQRLLKGGLSLLVTASDRALEERHRGGLVVGSYGLPVSAGVWHVPLETDAQGNGEVLITAHPRGLAKLELAECRGHDIAPAAVFNE